MHRDAWFVWYRRVFFVALLVYGVLTVYAVLGQPLLGWLGQFPARWFSLDGLVARIRNGAWALLLVSGGALIMCLVVRTIEWLDVRDAGRDRSSV